MMSSFEKALELLKSIFTWWFFVQPWEKAIRVRWGNRVTLCEPGTHFRLPFVDAIYVHNTRRMVCEVAPATLSSADGRVFVASCVVGFVVTDVLKLHTEVHDPKGVLQQRLTQGISEFFLASRGAEVNPAALKARLDAVPTDDLGLGGIEVSVQNFAAVSTMRLIQDSMHNQWQEPGVNTNVKLGDK